MPKLRNPQVVKIFFSSPFGGMEEEREELTRRYFPSIQHLCKSYGLQFAAVDMRWGITAESSDKSEVISICLRELDRSDMFIGFFGQRYGWHGANDESLQKNFNNALSQYPWLEQYRDKSVTELEFLHGFLNNPGQFPAAIFFRDKTYDDVMREEGLKKGDKKQVFKYSPESALSSKLMDDLKDRVWAQRDQSLGVHIDYKTPAEAARIMYDTIMSYLKETLLAEFTTQKRQVREELLGQHDAFLASRCTIFVHGESYIDQLNKQLLTENNQNVLVIGEAGSGKSALLCNWISSLKNNYRNTAVVYHFVGFADNSTDVNSMLARISAEFEFQLSRLTDGTANIEDSSQESNSTDGEDSYVKKTIQLRQRLLTSVDKLVSLGKTPVLVIDGLDKIIATSKIRKVLFWLPGHFPPSVKVVISTLVSDTANIEELGTRNYLKLHIDPLPKEAVHEMSVQTLHASGKELSPPQLERIVAAEMTQTPLFLKITLSELVAFGYFRMLDKKIDSLISAESTEALLQLVLTRLEEDYNVSDYHGNLVERVMCGIQMSSQGLTEPEIKEIFTIPDYIWSPLYFAIENLTIKQGGRIQFGYKELGEAVCARYLKDTNNREYIMKSLINYFSTEMEELIQSDCVDGGDLMTCRPAYELPPLFLNQGDIVKLADCLSNYFVFSHLGRSSPYLLVEFWHQTGLQESDITKRLLASFDKRIAEIYLHMEEQCRLEENEPPGFRLVGFLTCAENIMKIAGFATARKTFISRAVDIVEDSLQQGKVKDRDINLSFLRNLKYRLACIYCESLPTVEQGINLHKELLKQYESEFESTGSTPALLTELGHVSHGIGVGYVTLDKFSQAEEYVIQSIKYHEESGVGSLSDIGASWGVLALCCMKNEEYEKALKYADKALEALESYHFGETPPIIGELLTNKALCLKRMGRIDEAKEVYLESLAKKVNAVGRQHEIVGMVYMNLCALEARRDNIDEARKYAEEAVEIFESLGNVRQNPKYFASWENLIMCMVVKGNFAEADEHALRILKWRVEDGSMDYGIGSIYRDMAKYYLREEMYEKAYLVLHALMGSRFRDEMDSVTYILLDMACLKLPDSFTEKLEKEYTLAYGVEQNPGNVSLVKHLVENHLVPSNNTAEIVRLVNRIHSHSDMKDQVYVLTCPWCQNDQGEVNEECQQAILTAGLSKYPDNLDLNLSMAKSYRTQGAAEQAVPYALKVVEQQMDNPPLVMFTAHTALLAGDCDLCDKWCQHLLDNFTDENTIGPVNNLLVASKEVRKNQQQEQQPEAEQ